MRDEAVAAPGEFGQSILRLSVVVIGASYLAVAYYLGWFYDVRQTVLIVSGYAAGAIVHVALARFRPSTSKTRRLFSIALDQVFIPAMLGPGGGILAPFVGGPAFISIGNGLRFGPGWAYISGFAGAVSLSVMMYSTPFWRSIPLVAVGAVIFTFCLPAYAARLSTHIARNKARMERDALEMKERVRRAEELLRERQNDLAHVARLSSTTEIAMGIAHEVNQPLAAILSYNQACIRMLKQAPLDVEELSRAMAGSAAQAKRAGSIVETLRSFIHKREAKTEVMNLNLAASEALSLVKFGAKYSSVKTELDLSPESIMILGDFVQIQQVIVNISQNGFEALAESKVVHPKLTIKSYIDGLTAVLEISDNGPGIDEVVQPNLFYPFFTTKTNGMGLGLTISQTIVESFSGNIVVRNSSTGGAVFRLTFPLRENSDINSPRVPYE